MTYDDAYIQLKNGKSVYREGWANKNWVSLVYEPPFVGVHLDTAKSANMYLYHGDSTTGEKEPYGPTVEDVQAEDWGIFGEPRGDEDDERFVMDGEVHDSNDPEVVDSEDEFGNPTVPVDENQEASDDAEAEKKDKDNGLSAVFGDARMEDEGAPPAKRGRKSTK